MPRQVTATQNPPAPGESEFDFSGETTRTLTREDLRRHINQGRKYVWPPHDPNPREYVSVTNVLDAVPKPALPRWSAKLVAETAVDNLDLLSQMVHHDAEEAKRWLKGAPWAQRDKAADIGSAIHLMAEYDALGKSDLADQVFASLTDPVARAKASQARHFFKTVPMKILHTEFVVYSDKGYAGTGDFIVEFPAEMNFPGAEGEAADVVLDLKTGSGVWPEVALQIAGYRYADSMVDLDAVELIPMPATHGGAVIHVTTDGWELVPVDCGPETYQAFVALLGANQFLPLDRSSVGVPILRGKHTPVDTSKPAGKGTGGRGLRPTAVRKESA